MRPLAFLPALVLALWASTAAADHTVLLPGEQPGCPRAGASRADEGEVQEATVKAEKPAQRSPAPSTARSEKKKEERRDWRLEAL